MCKINMSWIKEKDIDENPLYVSIDKYNSDIGIIAKKIVTLEKVIWGIVENHDKDELLFLLENNQ